METETVTERIAANQDAFRQANERIESAADQVAHDLELLPFICECPRRDCTAIAKLKRHEYECVRAKGDRFFVAPGHEVVSVEGVTIARIGHRFERYTIMEKVGQAGERARELDARTG